jgi:manganese transport protein
VVLSFGIPFALVPLVALTARRSVTGDAMNRPAATVLAGLIAGVVITLNVALAILTA